MHFQKFNVSPFKAGTFFLLMLRRLTMVGCKTIQWTDFLLSDFPPFFSCPYSNSRCTRRGPPSERIKNYFFPLSLTHSFFIPLPLPLYLSSSSSHSLTLSHSLPLSISLPSFFPRSVCPYPTKSLYFSLFPSRSIILSPSLSLFIIPSLYLPVFPFPFSFSSLPLSHPLSPPFLIGALHHARTLSGCLSRSRTQRWHSRPLSEQQLLSST